MRRTAARKQKSPKLIKVHTSDEHGCKGCFFENNTGCPGDGVCTEENIIYIKDGIYQNEIWYTYIPKNRLGIESGMYRTNEIVQLLRKYKNNSNVIEFIADMLEV